MIRITGEYQRIRSAAFRYAIITLKMLRRHYFRSFRFRHAAAADAFSPLLTIRFRFVSYFFSCILLPLVSAAAMPCHYALLIFRRFRCHFSLAFHTC